MPQNIVFVKKSSTQAIAFAMKRELRQTACFLKERALKLWQKKSI
jgi:hypothetical protein